jgi:hypothetical protein
MSRQNLPLGLTALSYARDFVGIREEPGNRGPAVEYFLRQTGLGPGWPWCAAFVNGVIDIACAVHNVRSPFEGTIREAYVQDYVDFARRKTWLVPFTRAFPGCLFALWNDDLGRYAHIGFVTGVVGQNHLYYTVEGNTNDDGGREGHSVLERERQTDHRTLFLDWAPLRHAGPRWVNV